jgi:hypothetical protein
MRREENQDDCRPNSLLGLNKSITLQKAGLEFHRKLSFEDWELAGAPILKFMDSSTWWVADWVAYGETRFSERYKEAIQRTSLSYQTLRNYAWIARRFELSRRRDDLSFGHHAELAALGQPEQDYWLRKADEHHWSRNRLRAEVRASLRERRVQSPEAGRLRDEPCQDIAAEDDGDVALALSAAGQTLWVGLSSDQFARFKKAAVKHHLPLGVWVIKALHNAASSEYEVVTQISHMRQSQRARRSGTLNAARGNGCA